MLNFLYFNKISLDVFIQRLFIYISITYWRSIYAPKIHLLSFDDATLIITYIQHRFSEFCNRWSVVNILGSEWTAFHKHRDHTWRKQQHIKHITDDSSPLQSDFFPQPRKNQSTGDTANCTQSANNSYYGFGKALFYCVTYKYK